MVSTFPEQYQEEMDRLGLDSLLYCGGRHDGTQQKIPPGWAGCLYLADL